MSVPFHKQTDPAKMAGQHRYGFDREPYLKHSNVAPDEPRVEHTLNEYIKRKEEGPQRITFDEWIKEKVFTGETREYEWWRAGTSTTFCRSIWNAALTKGKL